MQTHELSYLDYYLPQDAVPIADMIEGLDDKAIPSLFGSKEDYLIFAESILELQDVRVEKQLTEAEMLSNVLTKLFGSHDIQPGEIDLIITTKEGEQDTKNSLIKFLQYQYKMSNAYVLNITGNHCANMAVAWNMVRTLGSTVNNVLIMNVFKTGCPEERIIGSYGILNDGAGVMLLSRKPGLCSLTDSVILSNGLLHKVDLEKDNSLLHLKYTVNSIKKLMTRNSTEPGQIRVIVPQNANILLVSKAVMESKMDIRKIFTDNISRCGHVDSVDFIINLKDVLDKGRFDPGDKLLSLNIGWAGSYVSSLISIN